MPRRLHESGPAMSNNSDMGGTDFGTKGMQWDRHRGTSPERMKAFLGTSAGKEYSAKLEEHQKHKREAYAAAREAQKGKRVRK